VEFWTFNHEILQKFVRVELAQGSQSSSVFTLEHWQIACLLDSATILFHQVTWRFSYLNLYLDSNPSGQRSSLECRLSIFLLARFPMDGLPAATLRNFCKSYIHCGVYISCSRRCLGKSEERGMSSLNSYINLFAVGILATLVLYFYFHKRNVFPLPPGPTPLPIIGNRHQLPQEKPWEKYTEWKETYGDHSRLQFIWLL